MSLLDTNKYLKNMELRLQSIITSCGVEGIKITKDQLITNKGHYMTITEIQTRLNSITNQLMALCNEINQPPTTTTDSLGVDKDSVIATSSTVKDSLTVPYSVTAPPVPAAPTPVVLSPIEQGYKDAKSKNTNGLFDLVKNFFNPKVP